MKRKVMVVVLSVLLLMAMGIAPLTASADSNIKIMKVNVTGARLRTGPSAEYEVRKSLSKGAKVFYLNKMKNSFAYVRTSKGTLGYIYKGYLDSYGTCKKSQVYYAKKSAKVYKKAKSGAKKVTTLSKKEHVIVYQVKGNWAYIKKLNGTGGYVKKSVLSKAS